MVVKAVWNIDCVEILTKVADVDWNIEDDRGYTVAMYAVCSDNVKLVQMLSKIKDIHWNIQNDDGLSPIMEAIKRRKLTGICRMIMVIQL